MVRAWLSMIVRTGPLLGSECMWSRSTAGSETRYSISSKVVSAQPNSHQNLSFLNAYKSTFWEMTTILKNLKVLPIKKKALATDLIFFSFFIDMLSWIKDKVGVTLTKFKNILVEYKLISLHITFTNQRPIQKFQKKILRDTYVSKLFFKFFSSMTVFQVNELCVYKKSEFW